MGTVTVNKGNVKQENKKRKYKTQFINFIKRSRAERFFFFDGPVLEL